MLWVTDAKYLGQYRLWVSFNDGASGEVDFESRLDGEIFEPLKDLTEFSRVSFEPEMDTIIWPNGANLAPEFLYQKMLELGRCVGGGHQASILDGSDEDILYVTAARHVGDYRVWLEFSDGTSGEADLSSALRGPMFEPLKDKAYFSQMKFDPEMDTIVWPNGADFAPEFLKGLVNQQTVVVAKAS